MKKKITITPVCVADLPDARVLVSSGMTELHPAVAIISNTPASALGSWVRPQCNSKRPFRHPLQIFVKIQMLLLEDPLLLENETECRQLIVL